MEIVKAKPQIFNVSMTSANTEYSKKLPTGTREFWIKLRTIGYDLKFAIDEGDSNITYDTVRSGEIHKEKDVKSSNITLFFQSPQAGMVAEIITFK